MLAYGVGMSSPQASITLNDLFRILEEISLAYRLPAYQTLTSKIIRNQEEECNAPR